MDRLIPMHQSSNGQSCLWIAILVQLADITGNLWGQIPASQIAEDTNQRSIIDAVPASPTPVLSPLHCHWTHLTDLLLHLFQGGRGVAFPGLLHSTHHNIPVSPPLGSRFPTQISCKRAQPGARWLEGTEDTW